MAGATTAPVTGSSLSASQAMWGTVAAHAMTQQQTAPATGALGSSHPAAQQLAPAHAVLATAAAECTTTPETAVSGLSPGSSPLVSQAMWGTAAAQPMTQQQTAPARGASGSSQGFTCPVSQAMGSICDSRETFQERVRSPQPTCRIGGAAQPRGQERSPFSSSGTSSTKTSQKRCVSPVPTCGRRSETQPQRRERPVAVPRLPEAVPRSFAEDRLDKAELCWHK